MYATRTVFFGTFSMTDSKILYIASQVNPYTEESQVGRICRQLPQVMQEDGAQIRVFMPRYGLINERRGQLHEVIRLSGMNLIIAQSDHQLIIKVASIAGARVQVYFIDNEDYFSRKALYTDADGKFFDDNDERAIFFARGVIETVKKLRWAPDIVHCHGWISAIAPLYLSKVFKSDPIFSKTKTVISLYDDAFEGTLDQSMAQKLKKEGIKLPELPFVENPTYVNLMKLAIEQSSGIVVCSDKVDQELITYAKSLDLPIIHHDASDESIDMVPIYKPFYEQILAK